jgi:hypothetical protein
MSELTVVSESELHICPECSEHLSTGSVEFLGDGLLVVPIYCEECDFHATEEWEHSQTVQAN